MSQGINGLLFKSFLIVFVLFCYKNATYWLNLIIYETETNNLLLNVLLLLLEMICLTTIIVNRQLIRIKGVHLIALLWFLLLFLVFIYNGFSLVLFLRCSVWPLLFETTYLFSIRLNNSEKKLYKWYWVVAFIGIYIFFSSMFFISFGGASNMIYFVLLTGPFLLLSKNKNIIYLILLCITVLAILSSKRSMILAVAMFWVIMGFIHAVKKGRIISTVIVGVLLSVFAIYSFQYIENRTGGSMSSRMDDEDITNGREVIYLETWMLFTESSTGHKILGNGHNAVLKNTYREISAHNEWLEILFDYGIIALFLYLCLWIYMVRKWLYLYKVESKYLMSYTLCLCIWAVMSMTSQIILYISYVLYLFMFLAFIEAKTNLKSITCNKL